MTALQVRWARGLAIAALLAALGVIGVLAGRQALATRPAVASFARLVDAANAGDINRARRECSAGYLAAHKLAKAEGGGLVGLPRAIHPNFRAWTEGDQVWICPGNREGPVYRFVPERGDFRFDGPAGLLRGRAVVPMEPDADDGAGAEKP